MCLICQRIQAIKEGKNPYFVKELESGYVVIGDHQHFKGYSLFLSKYHVEELHHLEPEIRQLFLIEMALVQEAVALAFKADKMNIELLGNEDTHLHWHLFPRQSGDLGSYGHQGKGPVWWLPKEIMYSDDKLIAGTELNKLKDKLGQSLDQLVLKTSDKAQF